MPEVLVKKRVIRQCKECGEEIEKGVVTCPEDESHKIVKTLVAVRKETVDEDEDFSDAEVEDLTDEDEDEDETDDEDEDDGDEDEDEEEEDDEEESAPESLTPVGKRAMTVEVMNLSTALAAKVSKIFKGNPKSAAKAYERVMTEFNGVMDAAADSYISGASISKSNEIDKQARLVLRRVSRIIKTEGGKAMPTKKQRPENFDELPDEVKSYITDLEGDDDAVEKADIYKGLTPEAAEIVRKSEKLIEQNTAEEFLTLAKSFEYVPGDKTELAKTLRTLSETDTKAFESMKNTLTATNENLKQGDIFKSYGSRREGDSTEDPKLKEARELVAKGTYATIEQAQVAVMGGESYKPTA